MQSRVPARSTAFATSCCFEQTGQASVEAALRAIDRLQAWGVRFVTVEELFRIKGVDVQDGVLYKCPGATHPAAG